MVDGCSVYDYFGLKFVSLLLRLTKELFLRLNYLTLMRYSKLASLSGFIIFVLINFDIETIEQESNIEQLMALSVAEVNVIASH